MSETKNPSAGPNSNRSRFIPADQREASVESGTAGCRDEAVECQDRPGASDTRSVTRRDFITRKFGAPDGATQALAGLSGRRSERGSRRSFVLSRKIDAPRELVFKLWTDRDHLMRWWGPKGVTVVSCHNDFTTGGMMHYCMRTPDGSEMWGKWVYREIEAPVRMVFVSSFADRNGRVARAPFADTWPLELSSTIAFEEERGSTTVTVQWAPFNATDVEWKTFDESRGSMQQGWIRIFDELLDYAVSLRANAAT